MLSLFFLIGVLNAKDEPIISYPTPPRPQESKAVFNWGEWNKTYVKIFVDGRDIWVERKEADKTLAKK